MLSQAPRQRVGGECRRRLVSMLSCAMESSAASSAALAANGCAPPPSALSPGGVRIAALLLGAIKSPHEASSQLALARASEVMWKWLVFSLLLVLRVRLADPVRACA